MTNDQLQKRYNKATKLKAQTRRYKPEGNIPEGNIPEGNKPEGDGPQTLSQRQQTVVVKVQGPVLDTTNWQNVSQLSKRNPKSGNVSPITTRSH